MANKKKKNVYAEELERIESGNYTSKIFTGDEQLNVPQIEREQSNSIFDNILNFTGLTKELEDGFQWTDIPKTGLNTIQTVFKTSQDIYNNLETGAISTVEGIVDAGANLVSGAFDEPTANKIREWAQKDFFADSPIRNFTSSNPFSAYSKVSDAILNGKFATLNPFDTKAQDEYRERIKEYSVSGDKLDNLEQGVGQLGGQAVLNSAGVPWQLTAFASSMGQEMNNAFQNNANYGQALLSGIISGTVEVGSEYIGGGANKLLGMTSLGSKAIEKLGSKIGNKVVQLLVKRGLDMAGEGAEEVVSGIGTAIGQKLTYMSDKKINELYSSDQALEDFINGALISGVANVGGDVLKASTPQGRNRLLNENAFTGMTDNEQKVYDRLINDETKKALDKNDGKKLTKKQINQIEENVREQMSNGRISLDYIEDTLGFGDRVNYLVNEAENSLARELNQEERRDIENQAREEILDTMGNDYILQESYLQDQLRRNKFEMDMSKVDEKLQDFYQKAIDSGMLNNTRDTHNFVDMLAKIHKDKGIDFDFTNNEKLAESGFALDGKTVNGYVTDNGITLNLNSKNALESTVGHEITHVLEGTDMYDALAKSIKEYAESTGEYAKRLKEVQDLYKDVENADATKELTADLVGDYLFTNQEFINHLTQNRNLFQKIYDEIKYLAKQVTAGSKEERKLNKAMKMFEKAYKKMSVKLAEQEASTQPKFSITQDSTGKELSKEQLEYFKDSKVRDDEGRLLEVYHGTNNEFNEFKNNVDDNTERIDAQLGFHFTPNQEYANIYGNLTKKVYLNMKNPLNLSELTNNDKQFLKENMNEIAYKNITNYLENGEPDAVKEYFVENDNLLNKIKNKYDGIIDQQGEFDEEYIVFNSNQIKNVDNLNPTDNPDIRYSLSQNEELNNYLENNDFSLDTNGSLKVNNLTDKQIKKLTKAYNKNGYTDVNENFVRNRIEEGFKIPRAVADTFIIDDLGYKPQIDTTQVFEDAEGNPLTKEQVEFYKDSDVRDIRGRLIPVYHTTDAEFTVFNPKAQTKNGKKYGKGLYFSTTPENFGNNEMKLYLNAKDGEYKFVQDKGYYIVQEPNMVKNVDNKTPTDNPDIRYSLTQKVDAELDDLTNEQYEYFKNTKAVNKDGELEVVYHGTPHDFSVFDIEKAGETGLMFGNGFYFTTSKGRAEAFIGDNDNGLKSGYVNIEKPASRDAKTMTYNEFYNLYNALNENPNMYDDEMGMSNIDALLSDYGDIYNDKENTIKKFYDSYDDDVSLIDNLSYIGNPTEMYKTLRDATGYDGIIVKKPSEFSSERWFVAFNPDQFKLKSNKTPTDNVDMNLSLSRIDDVAPTRKPGLTYGEDIAYQEEIAPYQQLLENLQEDIQNIKEDYRKQAEDIKKELQALREEREELDRGYNEVAPTEEYEPVESNIAPYESETYYPNTNVVPLDDKLLNKYKKYFKENFNFKGKQLNEAMEGIKELSANPELTQEDVYKYFKKNFGKEETKIINDAINELKSDLRFTEIGVSNEVKKDIAHRFDGFGNFRKQNFGKMKLVEFNGANGVDSVYKVLSEQHPGLLNPEETINPADQLIQLSEYANHKGYDTYFSELPDEIIRAYSNEMYSMIKDYRNETNQELAEEQLPLSYLEDIVPVQEEDTIDDYYNNLNQRIATLENKLNNLSREESVAIQMREFDESNKYRIKPTKKDIMDLFHQEIARKNGKKTQLSKPVIAKEKSSLRSGLDTLSTMFVNQNTEIDNLAKESGNKNIKFAGDMLNNYSAEAQNDVAVAQTDNYGNAIGKSVQQLFEPVKAKGLEAAFNDYLINYSNIDRWARGKGSQTPVDISERLVKNYEEQHPEFKKWAKDVWKFGENVRNNWLEAGMIKQSMYDLLSESYPHYVPYISDTNNFDAAMDKLNELKARPIKRAVGGATELFPVEEALTRYTFAQKRAYRQNELFKQIYNTLQTNPGQRGADVGEGYFTGEEPNLYRDDSGNYITALFDGEEHRIQVSDDLFKSLRNDMQTQIKDLENKLSIITKPLQTASDIRRKMLTSWSPSFTITNPLKDIQDAFFNSKHLKGMAKNYIPGIKELWTGSTPEARQFLALYGEGNLMGQFENESGLYDAKKGAKNGKFLKGLSKVNNIMELAPRYAEFKASLQAGESLAESMYNAREITTNFSRGGVITKALNRNGFTFLNASVQGFDKFIRNFSGENGARGIASSLLRAVMLGVAPAVFNELAFGGGDDKDEDYDALPDYIKDNYYLIKIGDGSFVRIPKGRMLSVFGSAARRTIELAEGEENAFEGYLSNVNNQIGINNPEENNIFSPFIQAYGTKNGTAWYGGDIVPTRLQDKPKGEQYDASIDKMSIWLGEHLGISPYKINYVLDQYSGGIGDILLPMITDEATSNGSLLAPLVDKFTADSTTDNKYVSDFYTKNDELKVQANSSKATDEDYLRNQYMKSISKEMSKLYAERRDIQADNSLSKSEKYEKSQAIKEQINKLAKYGLDSYDNISVTGNYAEVGDDMGYYKNAKGNWTPIDQKDIIATESIGLNDREKSTYYGIKNDMYNIDQKYEPKLKTASDEEKTVLNAQKKVDIINSIKNANLPDEAKAKLYDKKYASTETLDAVINCGIDFDSYLDLQAQNFTADKNIYGKTINGSKKNKVYNYINNLNMPYEQKIMLAKLEYKSDDTYNREIIDYLNNDNSISYQDMTEILKAMGFKVDEYGNITWE